MIKATITAATYKRSYGAGVFNHAKPIVIPRQSSVVSVPGPWQMNDKTNPQRPAELLGGKGVSQTVFVFDKSITGRLISTEGFGSNKVGGYWNQNNTAGDPSLRSTLMSIARDFTVDGRAEFRPYPMTPAPGWPQPPEEDIHGPDYLWRADGLCMQGSGNRGERLRLFNVPGTALIMRPGDDSQAAFYGLWDENYTIVDDVRVTQAINGVDISCGDAKLSRIWIDNVAKEGAILDLSGGYLDTDHICGADVACRIKSEIHASNCYHESARIGTIIEAGAHGCEFRGLNIGPGTCREFGLVMLSNGNRIHLAGRVGNPNSPNPQVIGVDNAGHANTITANLTIENGHVGARLAGNGGKLDLVAFQPNGGAAVEITKPINGWSIELRIQGYKNPVALNVKAMGTGNKVNIVTMGEKLQVLGTIPPGNEVWIDGQRGGMTKP